MVTVSSRRAAGETLAHLFFEAAFHNGDGTVSAYSFSPRALTHNLCSEEWDWVITLLPYNDVWKRHRPYLQKFLQPPGVSQYFGVQTKEAHKLCNLLLDSPEGFMHHIRS